MAEPRFRQNVIRHRPAVKYVNSGGADKHTHAHPHPEFIFVAGGSGRLEVEGRQFPIKAGDLIAISRNVSHSEYMFDTPDAAVFHLGFVRTVLSGMEEDEILGETFSIIHTGSRAEVIKAYFTAILSEHETRGVSSLVIEDDLMRVLLLTFLRLAVYDFGVSHGKAFTEAKDYFDKNFMSISGIEDVCKKLGINKFYLTHIFKEQLGMPPIRYLAIKRMDKAKNLLISTSAPVSEVAEKCGYHDTAYFCRVFKKVEGITPLQYRSKKSK